MNLAPLDALEALSQLLGCNSESDPVAQQHFTRKYRDFQRYA